MTLPTQINNSAASATAPQTNQANTGEGITVITHPHPKNNISSTPTPTIIRPPNDDASDPPPGKRVLPHPSKICPDIVPATSRAGEDLCPSFHNMDTTNKK